MQWTELNSSEDQHCNGAFRSVHQQSGSLWKVVGIALDVIIHTKLWPEALGIQEPNAQLPKHIHCLC